MKIDQFVDMMMFTADQIHLWHLQTKGYAQHLALGAYYDGIRDSVDSIAEKCMGYKGNRLSAKGGWKLVDFTGNSQITNHLVGVENYINDLYDEIAKDKKATHLLNEIDNVKALISQTKFMLTLG